MKEQVKEIRYFLFSQQLADGVRTTAAILLPAVFSFQVNLFPIGFTIAMGALCVSIADAPGPIINRRNGMLYCAILLFIVATVTVLLRTNVLLLGAEIALLCFFFSMFNVYGMRAAGVGNAALLAMILIMDKNLAGMTVLQHSALVLAGGLWYMIISLFFYQVMPYRPAQRFLGDSIREVARYLSIKASFYNVHTSLDEDYKNLVAQQIIVSEKQDAVREFFFKTKRILKERKKESRKLVATFIQAVDLFEDITATYYNYSVLRQRFQHNGILGHIHQVLMQMSTEIDAIGIAIQSKKQHKPTFNFDEAIIQLKNNIDTIKEKEPEENVVILKKILVNIRKMMQRINEMNYYFDQDKQFEQSQLDHDRFVSHQSLDPRLFWNNLTLNSAPFKHAVRVALACTIGFLFARMLAYGQHSYWILLTIAFILKPAFSLSKQRNVQRIAGTVAGGVLGTLILYYIPNTTVHFILLVLLMIGAYSYLRTNYSAMVICTTAYILILLQFLGIPFLDAVQERVFDTVLGCVIAFSCSYFIFPNWEAEQIQTYMSDVLKANAAYLQLFIDALEGKRPGQLEYKVARKDVYVSSANLTAAYQRMLDEPARKQINKQELHHFIVRNHLLFSNIATLTAHAPDAASPNLTNLANKTLHNLHGYIKKLNPLATFPTTQPVGINKTISKTHLKEETLLQQQLQFINELCGRIGKTIDALTAA